MCLRVGFCKTNFDFCFVLVALGLQVVFLCLLILTVGGEGGGVAFPELQEHLLQTISSPKLSGSFSLVRRLHLCPIAGILKRGCVELW